MKIKAGKPDETTYISFAISIIIMVIMIKNSNISFNMDVIWVFLGMINFGVNLGILIMRYIGWILPEQRNNQ